MLRLVNWSFIWRAAAARARPVAVTARWGPRTPPARARAWLRRAAPVCRPRL